MKLCFHAINNSNVCYLFGEPSESVPLNNVLRIMVALGKIPAVELCHIFFSPTGEIVSKYRMRDLAFTVGWDEMLEDISVHADVGDALKHVYDFTAVIGLFDGELLLNAEKMDGETLRTTLADKTLSNLYEYEYKW
jgi:hypothetical protein